MSDYEILIASNDTDVQHSSTLVYILSFLNANRASAQDSSGITFTTFLSSLVISAIYCVFQVVVFSLLRTKLKNIYQPNCYYIPDRDKVEPLNDGLFSWVPAVLLSPLEDYLKMGLDAYFFLRYLTTLLILFLGLALFNIPVLIPVNFLSGYDKYTQADVNYFHVNGTTPIAQGLDRISMSNIAPKFSSRLNIHLTMTVISIMWFHALLVYELFSYIRIKNQYLACESNFKTNDGAKDYNNTILIDNVPAKYLDRNELNKLFQKLCDARIRNIWFVYDLKDISKLYMTDVELSRVLEHQLTSRIYVEFFKSSLEQFPKGLKFKNKKMIINMNNLKSLKWVMRGYKFPRLALNDESLNSQIKETSFSLIHNRHQLFKTKLRVLLKDNGPINDHKYNKVFIQFEDSLHPEILNQIQIASHLNELDKTLIYIHPKDIVWGNLTVQSNLWVFARSVFANIMSFIITLGWVIPVAFIGFFSKVEVFTKLIPIFAWLTLLPTYITDVISNFISVILLMLLAELAPYIFRFFAIVKCKRTGAEIESDVQRWMFFFLFIHLFLVVTISTGFSVIAQNLVNNPVSVPNILATNLPKCSNFFFSYMIIRGLSYFGNNLVQNYQLFSNFFINPWFDVTPRQKFERLISLPEYRWGSVYPTFAVLGSIGLIYSIISPLILVFCVVAFFFALISFKYTLKYQYNLKNVSENYGKFYPTALFQLYSGIYFLECALIGIFALSRDENNDASALSHAVLTGMLLTFTVAGQVQIQKVFSKLLSKNIPMILARKSVCDQTEKIDDFEEGRFNNTNLNLTKGVDEKSEEATNNMNADFSNDTFFPECFQHNLRIVWIPKDIFNHSKNEIDRLTHMNIDCSDNNTELNANGDIELFNCPPDFVID